MGPNAGVSCPFPTALGRLSQGLCGKELLLPNAHIVLCLCLSVSVCLSPTFAPAVALSCD